jgi:hypothetical protein
MELDLKARIMDSLFNLKCFHYAEQLLTVVF